MSDMLFGGTRTGSRTRPGGGAQRVPANLVETANEWLVVAPMPGLEPQDISIQADLNHLLLRGEMRGPRQRHHRYIQHQWSYGPFECAIDLPKPSSVHLANAVYDNGMLSIAIPKVLRSDGPARPVRIAVRPTRATRGVHVGHRGVDEAGGSRQTGPRGA